jgi:hypothetical protein
MSDDRSGRRVAVFLLSARTMFEMLQPGRRWWVEQSPLPAGARLVGDEFDILRGVWQFLVEHESFAPVGEGTPPPELPWPTIHVERRATKDAP